MKYFIRTTVLTAILSTQLSACVGLLVAGAVGGASAVMDRRDVSVNATDRKIEFQASQLLAEKFPSAHINTEVFDYTVLLTGEVPNISVGKQAEALVRGLPNVRNVMNELAVGEPSNLSTRSSDALITTKIKALFVEDRLLQANAFVITTERGNVYLQGRVTQAEAARASEVARSVAGVRQVIKLFDNLTEEQFKKLGK
jgi:osmotically-inducible protein OsmY